MSASLVSEPKNAFVSNRILARLPFVSGINIELDGRNSVHRKLVETYIYDKFSESYGADVQHFLPYVFTLNCNENICATVGIRTAESEPLYLEKYLRYSIEQEIGIQFKTAIKRSSIVEIGNLVSTWRGSSQLLFIFLTDLLIRMNREWVVFTATKEVETLLNKMNFTLIHLADASAEMLSDEKDKWGSYYQENPKVMFGHIPTAMSILKQNTLMSSVLAMFSDRMEEIEQQWKIK